ncbi:MAG: response regulator [Negativicutes bacterium]|nr:response regulator [Negativicutes bacterium]
MKRTFYLVDDDPSIRRILHKIIEGDELGRVIGQADDGEKAEIEVANLDPDVVLIDLLLPNQDGVQTIQHLHEKNYQGQFIMISQVSEQTLIGQAYASGIEFFVHKPLNKVEIVSVIKSVLEKMQLQEAIATIRSSVTNLEPTGDPNAPNQAAAKNSTFDIDRARKVLLRILSDLGVLGEAGCRDIITIILFLLEDYEPGEGLIQLHHLQSVYKSVREQYEKTQEKGPSYDEKAIEQRVRRAVGAALHNVAALGIEDYGHQLFNTYANRLFDFSEVRNEMRYLRQESPYHGKINVKKFLEALLIEVQQQAKD